MHSKDTTQREDPQKESEAKAEKPVQLKVPEHSPDNQPRTQEQAVKEGEERDRLVYKADKE